MFAQSSWGLAQLDNLEVIKLISQVIADFANGEISQASSLFDCEVTLQRYLDKSFYKTASLIAASCRCEPRPLLFGIGHAGLGPAPTPNLCICRTGPPQC